MSLGKEFRMGRSGWSISDDIGCSCYRRFAEELVMRLGGLDLEEQRERRRSAVSLPDSLDIWIFLLPLSFEFHSFYFISYSVQVYILSQFLHSLHFISLCIEFQILLFYNIYHSKYNYAQFSTIIHYWCPSLCSLNTVSHFVKIIKTMISRKSFFIFFENVHDEILSFSHIYLFTLFLLPLFPIEIRFLNKSSPTLMLWAFDFISFLSSLTHWVAFMCVSWGWFTRILTT